MADYRKWFLALAVVAILLSLGTTPASAATPNPAFVCNANAGVPPLVRSEGITELVGDLILNCTGGNPTVAGGPVPLSNVQIFLNTNVTSRIVGASGLSEATLMIDEPLPPVAARVPDNTVFVPLGTPPPQVLCTPQGTPCPIVGDGFGTPYETIPGTPTVYSGRQAAVGSVSWNGVPIDAPGTVNTRVIRITNVRANACQLGTSSTLIPTQIVMFISVTGSQQVTINNPQQTVAFIQPGLIVGNTSASLLQCISDNPGLIASGNPITGADFQIRATEGFASSFKRRNITLTADGTTSPAPRAQNIPGYPYNTESGFYNPALFTATPVVGLADFGTRIRLTFNNIGAGVNIFVPVKVNLVIPGTATQTTPAQPPSPIAPGISGGQLTLVQTDQWGNSAPGFTAIAATVGPGLAQITSSGANTGYAVYEVVNSDVNVIERANINVFVSFIANTTNNLPAVGQTTANVSFGASGGPLASIQTADANAPIPRFCPSPNAINVFSINQCTCNLLWPFVTNQSGFNTGVALANTSADPYGTSAQQGKVTIYFYGGVAPASPAPPPITTTGSGTLGGIVPAGCELVFTLLNGGGVMPGNCATLVNASSTTTFDLPGHSMAGFQGYMISVANFQWCHGFAFISDTAATNLAEGYLAIQLDFPFNLSGFGSRTGVSGENEGH
jgi:hypothetical protein